MKNSQNVLPNRQSSRQADYKTYVLFGIITLVLGYLITKDINLPRFVTLPFAIAFLITLFYLSFTKPQSVLFVLLAYLPFSKIFVGQFGTGIVGLNITNFLMIFALISWLNFVQAKKERIFQKSTLNLIITIFCLWGLFSVLRARYIYGYYYDLESFFIEFKRWLTPIILYYIVLNMVRDKQTFKKAMFIIMMAIFVVSLMAIRDYMHFGDRGSMEESRIGGVFEQPNQLGAFFVYNMFFFITFFLYYWKAFKYWLLLIPFLTCFRGIMVTFSRGAYIAFGFGSIVTASFKSKVLFALILCAFIVVVLNPGFLPEGIRDRMTSTFGGGKVISTEIGDVIDPSATNRLFIWQAGLAMIKDQPIFGFGYGTFPYMIGSYIPQLANMDAHNTYLIIAAEMGIPALVLFLIILFILIKNSWWLLRKSKDRYFKAFALGALGGIGGLIAANMFGSRLNAQEVSAYFWVYSGLIMAAVSMKKKGLIN